MLFPDPCWIDWNTEHLKLLDGHRSSKPSLYNHLFKIKWTQQAWYLQHINTNAVTETSFCLLLGLGGAHGHAQNFVASTIRNETRVPVEQFMWWQLVLLVAQRVDFYCGKGKEPRGMLINGVCLRLFKDTKKPNNTLIGHNLQVHLQ